MGRAWEGGKNWGYFREGRREVGTGSGSRSRRSKKSYWRKPEESSLALGLLSAASSAADPGNLKFCLEERLEKKVRERVNSI